MRGIDSDPSLASLVRLLAAYGEAIDGMVVAEGVETDAELAVVAGAGVPLVQGYLLGRPGPPWPAVDTAPLAGLIAIAG